MSAPTILIVPLMAVLVISCSNAGFGGSDGTKSAPKAAPPATADASQNAAGSAAPVPVPPAPGPVVTTDANASGTGGANTDSNNAPSPAPPTGPGSDLTLIITDRDSRLDSFSVRNSVSQAWIPLTWKAGTQTIPNACSPQSKTILSLKMHSKAELLSSGADLVVGTCSAPLTQKTPSTVDIGVNPGCGILRAGFELSCSGSSALQVVP